MIARLFVALPFNIAVPDGEQFTLFTYEDDGFKVTLFPPIKTDLPALGDAPDAVLINEMPAFIANGLRIDFQKDYIDRSIGGPADPPEVVVSRAADFFLERLRLVTRAQWISPLRWPHVPWRIRYLNDDESEFAETPGLFRGRFSRAVNVFVVGINQDVWEQLHTLLPDFTTPTWETLRLDAIAALPHIGTAIVLAATSLEVFIAKVLDDLATKSPIPPDVWAWLNKRKNSLNDPSVEEQFDTLLKVLVGHSLKEDKTLWEAFMNLKKARNTFVHEGAAAIGGSPVSIEKAGQLIASTDLVIKWVRQWLPNELRWAEFEPKIKMTLEKEIWPASTPTSPE